MSRVGNSPVEVPSGATVMIGEDTVKVKGPKGELEFKMPGHISVQKDGSRLIVSRDDDSRKARSLHGLSRTLISNMVKGVTEGYEKVLEIQGVGYRATLKGSDLELHLGFSHPVLVSPPPGIEFKIQSPTRVVVSGCDKQKVGQIAADIRKMRKPEPYKGKGIRYRDEHIRRKVGKTIK
ncbi:MAG: 50S ribosomal protein L6 [Actinomycetota bacterium]|nr:50S ribosomal protein L6 [Actinomycetota bacterium]